MDHQDSHQNRPQIYRIEENIWERGGESNTKLFFTCGGLMIHSREIYRHNPSNTDQNPGRNSDETVEEKKSYFSPPP
jgi:hypothetical protein